MKRGGGVAMLGALGAIALTALLLGHFFGVVGVDGIVVVPALIGAIVVMAQPFLGLVTLVLLIPFEAATIGVLGQGSTATRLLGVLVAGAWLIAKLGRREPWEHIIQSRILAAIAVFVCFAMLSNLWAVVPFNVVSELMRFVMWASLTVLVLDLIRSFRDARILATALAIGGTIASILVAQQYFVGGAQRAGGDVAGGINATAVVLVSLLPLGFYLMRTSGILYKVIGAVHVSLSVLAIMLTFSRMAMLMVPVVIGLEYLYSFRSGQGRAALALCGGVGLAAALLFAPQTDIVSRASTIGPYLEATLQGGQEGEASGTSARGFHIRIALAVFRDHPVLGAGYQGYGYLFRDQYQFEVPGGGDFLYLTTRSAHGSLWAFLADLGLVGTALWFALLGFAVAAVWSARRTLRRIGLPGSEGLLLVHAVSLLLFVQIAFMAYAEIHVRKLFWVALGLAAALHRLAAIAEAENRGAMEVEDTPAAALGREGAGR